MARLIFSPLLSDARGKVGDVVFSGWKGTPYVRRRVIPANPNSAAQQAIRAAMTLCVASWQSLTANEQNSWLTYAAARSISSFNGFVKANVSQERTDDWRILNPANATIDSIETFTVSSGLTDGNLSCYWTLGDAISTASIQFRVRVRASGAVETADGSPLTASVLSATLSGLTTTSDYMVYGLTFGGSTEYGPSVYGNAVA
jgi:hypothetical protein